MKVTIKRVYDPVESGDGRRVLVDRLWPRGIRKDAAAFEHWYKELAPSDELRRWYGHQPDRFPEFSRRYRAELAGANEPLEDLRSTRGPVTLLTASRDLERSNAAVLADVLRG
jgi:uncharacterized protein YeaO (DUF488 family)